MLVTLELNDEHIAMLNIIVADQHRWENMHHAPWQTSPETILCVLAKQALRARFAQVQAQAERAAQGCWTHDAPHERNA